jgi:uncharacterized protein (TIGR03437 family)
LTHGGLFAGFLLALSAQAQLIPPGSPLPRTTLPPVVFINGFQFGGCPTTFANTFGIADQVLESNGEASVFFDTCSLPGTATIEDLAHAFDMFLSGLNYTDGTPVGLVDVVAHSMGGLVLRCYLSGKQDASGVFLPPPSPRVRKAVFLATPHFGTPIASLLGVSTQVDEMASGSAFLFSLGTWNDGTDDLRGVDAIAAAGNAGSGGLGNPSGFDDGVVPLTSASLQFYLPGRTRVVPYCHIDGGGIITLFDLCPGSAKGIADIDSATHDSAQMILSFLSGTSAWQSVGTAPEDDPFLSVDGGLIVAAHAADDTNLSINSATAGSQKLSTSSDHLAFADRVPAGTLSLAVASGSTNITASVNLPAGGTEPELVKPGPVIARIYPAAAANFPLALAPRMIVSIYGANLDSATVTADGSVLTVFYNSATQINALLPADDADFIPLTVQTAVGKNTVTLSLDAAAPAIFTQDSSGTGPASALKASDQSLVTAANPLHAGDAVELYATGLGLTTPNGISPGIQATVTVGGIACPVSFAGAAPNYQGLDQVNCTIPAGVTLGTSVPVVITSEDRTSNTATLAIQ